MQYFLQQILRYVTPRLALAIASILPSSAMVAYAQQNNKLEEIVVTGSYIKKSTVQLALPIELMSRDSLKHQAMPNITEMVLNMPWMSNTLNQAEPMYSNQEQTGTKNVNIRGLGRDRTLVLLNSKRVVSTGPIDGQGNAPVDIGNFPSIALGKIELLKGGGSTLYGSDAIAGVFNYKTRGDFDGSELNISYADNGGAKDYTIGAIAGTQQDNVSLVASIEYDERTRLSVPDAGLVNWRAPEEGGWFIGINPFGNPGTIWNPGAVGNGNTPFDVNDPNTLYQVDSDCNVSNGASHSIPLEVTTTTTESSGCGYNYLPFYNIIEPQERLKIFAEGAIKLFDKVELYGDILWSTLKAESWYMPSFPAIHAGYTYFVPADNPGYADWLNTQVAPEYQSYFAEGGSMFGSPIGVSESSNTLSREHTTWRVTSGARGEITKSTHFDIGFSYSESKSTTGYRDVLTDRFNAALQGFGGANCDASTGVAGVGDCMYYNPFYSANTQASLANDPALWNHLSVKSGWNIKRKSLVVDAIFSGDSPWSLAGGNAAWAAGIQYRGVKDTRTTWGPWSGSIDNIEATPYHLLSVTLGRDSEQETWAAYVETRLPLMEWLELNTAVRYEDYEIGAITTPSASLLVRPAHWLLLRASYEQSFRIPTASDNTHAIREMDDVTYLHETVFPDNRKPEKAESYNIGVVLTPAEHLQIIVDYYLVELNDTFTGEVIDQVVEQNSPDRVLRDANGNITRIITHAINGRSLTVSGVDFNIAWQATSPWGVWRAGLQGSYLDSYKMEGYTTANGERISSYEAAGGWNIRNANVFGLQSMPRLKYNAFVGLAHGNHSTNLYARYKGDVNLDDDERYVSEYKERGYGSTVHSWLTYDLHYAYRFSHEITLGFSVINLTDKKPPLAPIEFAYNPFDHNALGRVLKTTFSASF